MENNTTTGTSAGNGTTFKIFGTARDMYQQPLAGAIVNAYNVAINGRTLLGQATTAADGTYAINYTLDNSSTAALLAGVYDAKNNPIKESKIYYEVSAELNIDFDLSKQPFAGVAQYDEFLNILAPYTAEVPLAKMTETTDNKNISFIAQKTGIASKSVENLVMAARFETFSTVPAQVWFGILTKRMTASLDSTLTTVISAMSDFETRLTKTFDLLMHTPVATLNSYLQGAINDNIIAYAVTADLQRINGQLSVQSVTYAKQHPVTGRPSLLHQKAELAGLKGDELHAFVELKNNHTGTEDSFWEKVADSSALKGAKKPDAVKAVFHIARLTGNNLQLTENLVKTHDIKSAAHIKKLAEFTRDDWANLLKEHAIAPGAAIPGESDEEKTQNYAAQLDAAFAKEYPTASFAARLQKDTQSTLPHKDKVSKFLQKNEDFDLLNHHVGTYIKNNPKAVSEKDAADVAHHVRRIQRVMRLTPAYDNAALLLNDDIHSAHQVYKMGKDNFVKTYGDKLGEKEAQQIFQKAETVHATAIALAGNLRSLSDASAMKAFPDFSAAISQQLSSDLPDLETLFGHTDYCDCSECSSVYGAPAYLTDILHYLDKRNSTLPVNNGKVPSVKDILLRRRPDIGDIDLECDNTNTQVPYIDISCEVMEDYIAPPVITLANTFLTSLVKGIIGASLLAAIKTQFITTGQSNIGNLLSAAATVSDSYVVRHLQTDGTYLSQTHWIIRDTHITLRASSIISTGTIELRALHQTLLSAETISSGPEYVNAIAYNNFLKTAKAPFTLPFDLFETEGELYLEKLGVKKGDLIDIFRKEDKALPGASSTDIKVSYANLGINQAEQALIFLSDTTHQSLYWGTAASGTSIQVDIFEKLTGLNYSQVLNLIQLQFINPAKDTAIEHDDLSSDRTKQRLTNLTSIKLDAIHRFLRLWRKTTLTMDELDVIIMAPLIGGGKIVNTLALRLDQFLTIRKILNVSVFKLLAFYQNIDTTHNLPDCLYNEMFQNSVITSPVSPNFSIAAATAGNLTIAEADKAVIAAVLQIAVSDVNALMAKAGTKITLLGLSVMYRYAQLAQSLDLPVNDLLKLVNLIDANPFLNLQSTTLFIQKYQLLQVSNFSIDDLNYILRHQDDGSHLLVPSDGQVFAALSQLQNELLAVNTATQPATDTNGSLLTKWLSDVLFNWHPDLLTRLLDILNTIDNTNYQQKITNNNNFLLNLRMVYHGAVITADLATLPVTTTAPVVPITFPATIVSQLSYDTDKKLLVLKGYMSATDKTALLALSKDAAYQAAINVLFNAAQQTDSSPANLLFPAAADITALKALLNGNTAGRFAILINKLSPVYKKLQQQNILVKDISTWFKTDKKPVIQLLTSIPGIYTDLTDNNFITKALPVNNPAQVNRYQFLAKVCFIATKLNLTDTDIAFLLAHAADINSLNLLTLPLVPVTTAATTFPAFEALLSLLQFQQFYPAKITDTVNNTTLSIYTILTDAISRGTLTGAALTVYTADLIANLALLTGWNTADLTAFISLPTTGITLTLPADIKSMPILLRLHRRFLILQQLGIAAADGFAWAKDSLAAADTAKIKQALKQRYSNDDWLQVSKPLQDTLREKKRDALIAYLLANPGAQGWKDANDLYSYFLLDVEMCSCQPTSRIVQATNSVQLFVQRCFLSLENSVIVDSKADSDWLQWQWMKNFRVWQANVKVFLYPENYIEPELLPVDVKSPFLTDLENDLLQNEVTQANVEDAFETYLGKLDDVARLEMKATWYDDPSDTLHVVGRTYGGDPKIYYHRRLLQGRRWTPWVKIDLDIAGDHTVLVMHNNKLFLFWAVITEQADDAQAINVPVAGQGNLPLTQPSKRWHVQLAFSEYKKNKWTPKKVSNPDSTGEVIATQFIFTAKENFLFTPFDLPDFDYNHILDANGNPVDTSDNFNKKISPAIQKDGNLVINCYYFMPQFNQSIFIGSFVLDPVKGHPVAMEVGYNITLFASTNSALSNMLDVENVPAPTGQPSSTIFTPNKAKGGARNLKSMQMGFSDRMSYMMDVYRKLTLKSNDSITISVGNLLDLFYQDLHRTYRVVFELSDNGGLEFGYREIRALYIIFMEQGFDAYADALDDWFAKIGNSPVNTRFYNFYHPLLHHFMLQLINNGIDALMDRGTQLKEDFAYDPNGSKTSFADYYSPDEFIYSDALRPVTYPNGVVDATPGYPKDDVDFNIKSGYGLYNWELFFHAPLMIAERLSQNQQFDDADRWYRYIFNPTDTSDNPAPNKFWNTKPFFLTTSQDYLNQRIDNVLKGINTGTQQDLVQDVTDWRNNPFQPHFIAEYRTVAYQKVAVMKYVGHLIRYGDYLFAQDTMESVNQATQLYILAAEILGPKPEIIPSAIKPAVDNYYQLEQKLDAMSDALVNVENLLPLHTVKGYTGTTPAQGLPTLQNLYFCIPVNENMMGSTGYWDIVADRLFKIRHCLNIDGTLAPLSLFAPVIDPGMLVRASAAGLDIGSILSDVNSPLPLYRFAAMIQKAVELCNDVKSLGALMLSVLEKKDAEALSLLRAGQEIKVVTNTLLIKQKQIDDAQSALDNLTKLRELTTIRQKYYSGLINQGLTSGETLASNLNTASAVLETAIGLGYVLAAGLNVIPNFTVGVSGLGSPVATATSGGKTAADSAEYAAKTLSTVATALDKVAALTSTTAGYQRRAAEWQFQLDLAAKELEQIDKQIAGGRIRLDIANQDVSNQQLLIDQASETNDFMHSKFTNEELFNWMITQTSTTYFRSYQLAYDVAKQAERCFRYELGLTDSAYINFGYWDSLKKGLMAGEQLLYDLKNMEMAYHEQNKRELELTKPISLSQLDPVALLKLKTTGECWISLPEELFDMDYPGHYMRRIKSVSLTIPCITGPYTTVNCKLTMTNNSVRTSGTAPADPTQYPRKVLNGLPADDNRFRDAIGSVQSIATSTAQNDSGLFELNFRDERYLPFEGAGAISLWHIELPAAVKQFDYNTITDVIIHLKYTARDGGDLLKASAKTNLTARINQMLVSTKDTGLIRAFSAKNDMPTEWYKFLNPANATDDQTFTLNLDKSHFPFFAQGKTIKIRTIELIADSTKVPINGLKVTPAPTAPTAINLTATNIYGSLLSVSMTYNNDPGIWSIVNPVANARLTDAVLKNMIIIVHYVIA